ncbi:hypothetical protein EGR_01050 [Echinococcus granulosus]|uniref:Uncharacterized protein n=1 Tax=Echinococcus granulosus TaxID=6210 RepID=W6UZ06_ECHGR|nr:hypothetical protein EGR_01050 [Echinococcus granulosus]EUB63922.1 hypothetical protein EGR_01050 [Echinococcus granulosus]
MSSLHLVSTTPTLAVDEVQPSGKLTMAYRCPPIATAHKERAPSLDSRTEAMGVV